MHLFTYLFLIEKQKKDENVPGYTEDFFSFSSAIYVQIFPWFSLIFICPVNCWSEWCITTADHSSVEVTVSDTVWKSLLSHGSSPFFPQEKKHRL